MIKRLVSLLALIALIFTLPCYAYATECKENVSIIVNEIIETAGYGPGDYFVFSGIFSNTTFSLFASIKVTSAVPSLSDANAVSASPFLYLYFTFFFKTRYVYFCNVYTIVKHRAHIFNI